MLAEWKAQREAEAGIDVAALAGLTDERLVGLIEKALANISPQRLLTVELGLGVAARGQTIILPTETAKDYFEIYAEQGPAVLVLTVRSMGGLKASVDSHDLRLVPIGDKLMGINDFPSINPPLPCAVDIGESQRWLYELTNVAALIGGHTCVRRSSSYSAAGWFGEIATTIYVVYEVQGLYSAPIRAAVKALAVPKDVRS